MTGCGVHAAAAQYFLSSGNGIPAEGKFTLCPHPVSHLVSLVSCPCPIDLLSQGIITPECAAHYFQYRLQMCIQLNTLVLITITLVRMVGLQDVVKQIIYQLF